MIFFFSRVRFESAGHLVPYALDAMRVSGAMALPVTEGSDLPGGKHILIYCCMMMMVKYAYKNIPLKFCAFLDSMSLWNHWPLLIHRILNRIIITYFVLFIYFVMCGIKLFKSLSFTVGICHAEACKRKRAFWQKLCMRYNILEIPSQEDSPGNSPETPLSSAPQSMSLCMWICMFSLSVCSFTWKSRTQLIFFPLTLITFLTRWVFHDIWSTIKLNSRSWPDEHLALLNIGL